MVASVTDDPVLKRFRSELDRAYGDRIERVVLFGSRARGDHREDSDYDIAVFLRSMDDWFDDALRIGELSSGVLRDTGAYIAAKPFGVDAYASASPFMTEVRRDGLML